MSCNLNDSAAMVEMQAGIFDDLRPAGANLYLLKRAGQTKKFAVVLEIQSGWHVIFDKEFRDDMKVLIATAADLRDPIGQSSFLAYGVGVSGDEIDVFSFESKDATRPNASSPNWKIYGKREAAERFTIP